MNNNAETAGFAQPPNVISLEDIELHVNPENVPPSLEHPDHPNNLIFKDVPGTIPEITNPLLEIIEKVLVANLEIKLTEEEIKVLKVIMNNSPSSLTDIENTLKGIIADNTINAADIPKFLILIKEFHELILDNSLNTKFSGEQLIYISVGIIKFLIPIILKKLDLDNDTIIQSMNTILAAAAELLLFIPIIKKGKLGLFCF